MCVPKIVFGLFAFPAYKVKVPNPLLDDNFDSPDREIHIWWLHGGGRQANQRMSLEIGIGGGTNIILIR